MRRSAGLLGRLVRFSDASLQQTAAVWSAGGATAAQALGTTSGRRAFHAWLRSSASAGKCQSSQVRCNLRRRRAFVAAHHHSFPSGPLSARRPTVCSLSQANQQRSLLSQGLRRSYCSQAPKSGEPAVVPAAHPCVHILAGTQRIYASACGATRLLSWRRMGKVLSEGQRQAADRRHERQRRWQRQRRKQQAGGVARGGPAGRLSGPVAAAACYWCVRPSSL